MYAGMGALRSPCSTFRFQPLRVSFIVVPTAVETNGVGTRRDSKPKLDSSRDETHPVQSDSIGDAISPSVAVPHGARLPRLLCRERPRAWVMCYTAAVAAAAPLLLLLLLLPS